MTVWEFYDLINGKVFRGYKCVKEGRLNLNTLLKLENDLHFNRPLLYFLIIKNTLEVVNYL